MYPFDMELIQQILFLALTSLSIFLFSVRAIRIKRNILLGQPEPLNDQPLVRWKNMLLLALGQRKMFKNPTVAVLHLVIYMGFLVINIELLEIFVDGLFGTHRIFFPLIPSIYSFLINSFELFAVAILLVCVVFLIRRNLLHIRRFRSLDLKGWAFRDANIILLAEIVLMALFLSMNATDTLLQERGFAPYANHSTGSFFFSSLLQPLFIGYKTETLVIIERACWWLHITGIFAFLNYLPWSKHLHILLAFPNAYFMRLHGPGRFTNMPTVQREVLYAFNPDLASSSTTTPQQTVFGARDVQDLSWKNLLDAYSCTECGKCSDACPAHQTGKLLSPRKIMMQTRDRSEEVGRIIDRKGKFTGDEKFLLGDYISEEELRACTTCNACVEECPVSISPVDIIVQLRRYLIMEKSSAPQEWTMMFGNIENNFAPWKFSPDQRAAWLND